MTYRFDQFVLDEDSRQLRRNNKEIVVQPLVFDLLLMLVSNRSRVVSKDELLDTLWHGAVVSEGSLQRAISVARAALGDKSHELIRTYSGYGYRFCGELRAGSAAYSGPHGPLPDFSAPRPHIEYVRTRDGVRIAYWTLGQGPALVYVPNLIWNHSQLEWKFPEIRRWYETLARGRTVIRFDPRGTGSSQRDLPYYSLPAIQLDVEAVVDRLGLENFTLFGDLNGGPVVMRYAADNPDRISGIILWHSFAKTEEIAGPKIRMIESLQPLMENDWETYTETRAHMGLGWSDGESARRYARLMRQCVSPQMALRSYQAGREDDVTPLLPRITAPALVLHRRKFHFWDVRVSRRLAARLGNARLVVLDGSGSAPFLGDYEEVATAIDSLGD